MNKIDFPWIFSKICRANTVNPIALSANRRLSKKGRVGGMKRIKRKRGKRERGERKTGRKKERKKEKMKKKKKRKKERKKRIM